MESINAVVDDVEADMTTELDQGGLLEFEFENQGEQSDIHVDVPADTTTDILTNVPAAVSDSDEDEQNIQEPSKGV